MCVVSRAGSCCAGSHGTQDARRGAAATSSWLSCDLGSAAGPAQPTLDDAARRWGLKNIGITAPNFSWAGPHQVPVNMVFGAPIKVGRYHLHATRKVITAWLATVRGCCSAHHWPSDECMH